MAGHGGRCDPFYSNVLQGSDGERIGEPLVLAPFQRKFVEAIYDNPYGKRRAILSVSRKNAKTPLAACTMLNHLVGPSAQARRNSDLFSTANSRDQAAILFSVASKMVRLDPMLRDLVKIHESRKAMSCPELGARYAALSSGGTLALGLAPTLHVCDEAGAVVGPRFELYENMDHRRDQQPADDHHQHSGCQFLRHPLFADRLGFARRRSDNDLSLLQRADRRRRLQ